MPTSNASPSSDHENAADLGAVIVAAGRSERMSGLDKVFASLAGKPVLCRAVAPFEQSPLVHCIVIVLEPSRVELGWHYARQEGWRKVTRVCAGGLRRQDSVRLGLEQLPPTRWVAVHDGARPLLDPHLIARGLAIVKEGGAAVPAVEPADTVKELGPNGLVVGTLDRSSLWLVQTPQFFVRKLLERAHCEVSDDVTDDAAMVERLGLPVRFFPGDRLNLKITTPEDLEIAEALLCCRLVP